MTVQRRLAAMRRWPLRPLFVVMTFWVAGVLALMLAYGHLSGLSVGVSNFGGGRLHVEAGRSGPGNAVALQGQIEGAANRSQEQQGEAPVGFGGSDDPTTDQALIAEPGFATGNGAAPISGSACAFSDAFKSVGEDSVSCARLGAELKKLDALSPGVVNATVAVVAQQLVFLGGAAVAVLLVILIAFALAILIDFLQEQLGWRAGATLVNRVIDTVPYTIYLVIAIAAFSWISFAFSATGAGMSFTEALGIWVGQLVVYVGVALLLMPVLLNVILEVLRAERREGVFDQVAMDGLPTVRAYLRVVSRNSFNTVFKPFLFALIFVVLFDPLFERISQSRALDQAGQPEGHVPRQAFQSPGYQWALLRFDDPGDLFWQSAEVEAVRRDLISAMTGNSMAVVAKTAGRAHFRRPVDGASVFLLEQMVTFPGLMLDRTRWAIVVRNDGLCGRSQTCMGIKSSGVIGSTVGRIAIREAFAVAYFWINIGILLFLIGPLAAYEFQLLYRKRTEQV